MFERYRNVNLGPNQAQQAIYTYKSIRTRDDAISTVFGETIAYARTPSKKNLYHGNSAGLAGLYELNFLTWLFQTQLYSELTAKTTLPLTREDYSNLAFF